MKTQVTSYTFNKTNKTITFTGYASISLDRVLLVVNVTSGIIIYNFADPAKGGTVATNVLTLEYNTASMNDADKLLIYYDDPDAFTRVQEVKKPVAEDNEAGIIAILPKPVNSPTYAPNTYKDYGTVTKANIKSSPGNVYAIRAINMNTVKRYFQLHNKASAPAAGETPVTSFIIPGGTADSPGVLVLTPNDLVPSERFETGISWAISTTPSTFTDSATAGEHQVVGKYV